MSLIIAGRPGAREVALTTRRSRDGRDIIRTIVGPAADVFAVEANVYAGGATEVNTTQQVGSPLATMVARYSFANGETPEEDNGLISEEVSATYSKTPIPIRQHQYFAGLDINEVIEIDTAINANENYPGSSGGVTGETLGEEYYLLRRVGVNEFDAELPSVRYTLRCSAQYAGLLETEHVGKIFTKSQMLERIAAPRFFDVTEPADVFLANAYQFFFTGWRLTASVSFDNDGNGILEETYTWGQFAEQLYTAYAP